MRILVIRKKPMATRNLGSFIGEKRKKLAASSTRAPKPIHAEDILDVEALPLNVLTDILFKMPTFDRAQAARASPSIYRLTSDARDLYPHILGTLHLTIADRAPTADWIRKTEPSLAPGVWSDRETFYVTSAGESGKSVHRDFRERIAFLRPRLPAFHTIRLSLSPEPNPVTPGAKTEIALTFFALLDECGWKGNLELVDEFCKPNELQTTFPALNKLAAAGVTLGLMHPVNRTYYESKRMRLDWTALALALPRRSTVTHLAFESIYCSKEISSYLFDLTALTLPCCCFAFFHPQLEMSAHLSQTLEALHIDDFMDDESYMSSGPSSKVRVPGDSFVNTYGVLATMPRLRSLRLYSPFSEEDDFKARGAVMQRLHELSPEPVFRAVRELSIGVRLARRSEHSPCCWPFHHYPALERLELAVDCSSPRYDDTVTREIAFEGDTFYNHYIELDSEELGKIGTLKELRIRLARQPDVTDPEDDDPEDDGFLSGVILVDARPPGTVVADAAAADPSLLPLPIEANLDWCTRKKSMRVDYVVFDLESLRRKRRATARAREFARGAAAAPAPALAPAKAKAKAPPRAAAVIESEAGPSSAGNVALASGGRRSVRAVRASSKVAEATEAAEAIKGARAERAEAAAAEKPKAKAAAAAALEAAEGEAGVRTRVFTEKDLVPGPSRTLTMLLID